MPTDWTYFRKIAERPSSKFMRLKGWVRGYASEMVRFAGRPNGLLCDSSDVLDVARVIFVGDDEHEMLTSAIAQLLEVGFLEERENGLFIANFREAQESRDAKRKRQRVAESPERRGKSGTARNGAEETDALKTRLDQTRLEDPPLPPTPEPESPPRPKTLPGSDAPVAQRAKRFERDPGGRIYLGDPREWPEFKLILAEYGKRFGSTPKLSDYARDKRVRAVVAALIDYTPDQIRLAIREASRSDFKEDRFRQLDCVLHDGAKIDSWLESAPQSLREAAARNALAGERKRVRDPVAAEQTLSDTIPMPEHLRNLTAAIGTGGT